MVFRSQAQQHDPETARRARLAALEARTAGEGESGAQSGRGRDSGGQRGEEAAPLLASSDHDVLTLQVSERAISATVLHCSLFAPSAVDAVFSFYRFFSLGF